MYVFESYEIKDDDTINDNNKGGTVTERELNRIDLSEN